MLGRGGGERERETERQRERERQRETETDRGWQRQTGMEVEGEGRCLGGCLKGFTHRSNIAPGGQFEQQLRQLHHTTLHNMLGTPISPRAGWSASDDASELSDEAAGAPASDFSSCGLDI